MQQRKDDFTTLTDLISTNQRKNSDSIAAVKQDLLEQSKLLHNSERDRVDEEQIIEKLKSSEQFADFVKVEEVKEAFEKLTDSFQRRLGENE